MIKKLKQRIFLIMMISLSMVILGIVILFGYFNYKNIIITSTSITNRFIDGQRREENRQVEEMPDNAEKNENIVEEPKEDILKDINIDGVYNLLVKDNKVLKNPNTSYNEKIEKYAIELSTKNRENGIIGKYIYQVKKIGESTYSVTIIEDENAIAHIRKIVISSILVSALSLIIIYIIATEISKIIVRPVNNTFEKQKQFISDASHELKTPLAVIEANADVLENEVGDNKWLGYIQNELESMNKLINELLMLTKIENIDNIRDYKNFDVSKESEIIVSMFESMAYEKGIKIEINIKENINMNGCKEDIEHILSTLLDNAIKHTKEKGRVIVELSKEKSDLILQVKNMGEPIPQEEKEKIFERFYRIDKSRNRNEKRYGLGLAIAKSTVEKYKGKIKTYYKDGFNIFEVNIPI